MADDNPGATPASYGGEADTQEPASPGPATSHDGARSSGGGGRFGALKAKANAAKDTGLAKASHLKDTGVAKGTEAKTAASEKAAVAKVQAVDKATVAKGKVAEKVPDSVKEKANVAQDFANEKRAALQEGLRKQKEELQARFNEVLELKLNDALDRVGETVKRKVKDPDMPGFVMDGIDSTVDELWPDVKLEVIDRVLSFTREVVPIDHGEPPSCCPNPIAPLRAFILYTLYPYDRSIWRQLKDPFFWILTLISLIPVFGVSQIFYLFVILLIDKSDEYQLCNFVLGFKSIQFFSVGVFQCVIGSIQYYLCAVVDKDTEPVAGDEAIKSSCFKDSGPREALWVFAFFVLQIVMVWGATLLLPFSKKNGGKRYRVMGEREAQFDVDGDGVLDASEIQKMYQIRSHNKNNETKLTDADLTYTTCCGCTAHKGRGGLLPKMVIYDAIVFGIVVLTMIIALVVGPAEAKGDVVEEDQSWRYWMTLFWCKAFYGLLSWPFLVFKVPLLIDFLTHARPTAYNRNGKTVPVESPEVGEPEPVEDVEMDVLEMEPTDNNV